MNLRLHLMALSSASAACGLLGCSTTYGRCPLARLAAPDARYQLTYEDSRAVDVLPSAPQPLSTFPRRGPPASTPLAVSSQALAPAHSVMAYNAAAAFSSAPPSSVSNHFDINLFSFLYVLINLSLCFSACAIQELGGGVVFLPRLTLSLLVPARTCMHFAFFSIV